VTGLACCGDATASDAELLARQYALQDEARQLLAGLDLAGLVAGIGPLLVAGSFVSGLLCWREIDVMVLVGGDFSPSDVFRLLQKIVGQTGATSLEYHDERGPRCVTGQVRDERYHVPLPWTGLAGPADRPDAVAARCACQCRSLARRTARSHHR
jgi:hypothetical protein